MSNSAAYWWFGTIAIGIISVIGGGIESIINVFPQLVVLKPHLDNVKVVAMIIILVYHGLIGFIFRPSKVDRTLISKQLEIFLNCVGFKDISSFRCTLWLPKGKYLHAAVPYVPGGKITPSIKKLHTAQGLVGLVYRTGECFQMFLEGVNADEYRNMLVTQYGFEVDQAAKIQVGKKLLIAIPIISDSLCIGVIYLDSTDAGLASDPENLREIVRRAEQIAGLLIPVIKR